MRFVSPVALGLMLAMTGASFGGAAPAAMAKEAKAGKAANAPKLKLSPEFIPAIMKASEAVGKKDIEGAKAALPAAEALAKTPDDKYQYYVIVLNLAGLLNDGMMQGKAVAGMLDTGLVTPAQMPIFLGVAAGYDADNNNYDSALARVEKARAMGVATPEISLAAAKAYWGKAGTGKGSAEPARSLIANGLREFRAAIDGNKAAGKPVPAQWYSVAVSKADAAGLPELGDWAKMAYTAAPSGQNLRTVLRVLQRNTPTMSGKENLDLLRLMSISGGLAIRPDFIEYAEMAFKGGIYGEVKQAIDAGRSKAVLQSGDGADYYSIASQKIGPDKASLVSAESDAAKSAKAVTASAAADAFLGYGDYAKAITLYRVALGKSGVDSAEVNTHMGIALVRAGDLAGAKEAFAKVTTGTRGEIAKLWLLWIANKTPA
jgi:tetratricopeptide (TPR) repeat protein